MKNGYLAATDDVLAGFWFRVVFSHMASLVESGTELCLFFRIFLLNFQTRIKEKRSSYNTLF